MSETKGERRADDEALDLIFREGRTHVAWSSRSVSEPLLRELYDLAKWGPTSANSCPARFVFLTSPAAKERLRPALAEGNVEKTMTAPVTVIIAQDMEFFERLPELMPGGDFRSYFVNNPALIGPTAIRNSSLQGAYLILAARALGLDCGPMSGFDVAKIEAEFFHDGRWKANFLCNLGYGDDSKLRPRAPRLSFEDACVVL